MLEYAEPVVKLIDELRRLPGVGGKSAQRIAFHILRAEPAALERLISSINEVREKIVLALAWLGFALDEAANAQNALRIAPHGGKPVYAIPTDEERMIARHTRLIISA